MTGFSYVICGRQPTADSVPLFQALSSLLNQHKGKSMTSAREKSAAARVDAISLLKADHRQVEALFSDFERAINDAKKQQLASMICAALTIHTTIEEEIFYPAFMEATGDRDVHHEAVVEHDSARKLMAEIESMSPADDYFDASVSVLSEMIRHHVKEEEKAGGMFSEARKSDIDLKSLGEKLLARKQELQSQSKAA